MPTCKKLYSDVESLYRLGQGSDASFGKKELGCHAPDFRDPVKLHLQSPGF